MPVDTPLLNQFNRNVLPDMLHAADGRRTFQLIQQIVETDQYNSFDQFHKTTDTLTAAFNSAGTKPEVYEIPTGGPIGSGRWIIHEAQDFRSAALSIILPVRKKILDFNNSPWHLIQWTASTPPQGIIGEVIVNDDLDQVEKLPAGSLTGKFLLTKKSPYARVQKLAATGIVGVICDRPIPNNPDALPWTKFGWGGIPISQAAAQLVGLVLSENQGKQLRRLCTSSKTVKVKATVDAPRYVGSHDLIHATIPGRNLDAPEIWAIAHTAEPGALDNASGVATCVEIAHILHSLVNNKILDKPERTIRLLVGYECYSFFHYLEHAKRKQPPLAGVCLDEVGTKPAECNGRLEWHDTIPMSAGFVNQLGQTIINATLKHQNPGYKCIPSPFVSTCDTLIGDPQYGFPCPWLTTGYPKKGKAFDAYHSSADTIRYVAPKPLATCAAAMAGYLYYLANLDHHQSCELAAEQTKLIEKQLTSLNSKTTPAKIQYLIDAHQVSINQLKHFAGSQNRSTITRLNAMKKHIADMANHVKTSGKSSKPTRTRDAGKIPVRIAVLSPTLENTPQPIADQIRDSKLRDWALFWADGKRTLADITDALVCEYNKTVDIKNVIQFFDAHEQLGYIRYRK